MRAVVTGASRSRTFLARSGIRTDLGSWKRYLTIGLLCAAQTFPSAFSTSFIPTVFRSQGLELKDFWIFSLLLVPVWLKWLWAPLIDLYGSRRFGRRKSWIVPTTVLGAALYCTLAFVPPSPATVWTTISMLVVIAFVMHTQDTAVDAYTLESLEPSERGIGTGVKTLFEALGDLVAIAGVMAVYQLYGWAVAAPFAAGFLLLASLPAFFRRERPWSPAIEERRGPRPNVLVFLRRPDARWISGALVVAGSANYALFPLAGAMLIDLGFSFVQIGLLLGAVYSTVYLIGSAFAAVLITRVRMERLLLMLAIAAPCAYVVTASVVQSGTVSMGAAALALAGPVLVESCGHAAVVVSRMNWCSTNQAATDFAIQGTFYNVGRTLAGAAGGVVAYALGWTGFLLFAGVFVAAAILLLARAVHVSSRFGTTPDNTISSAGNEREPPAVHDDGSGATRTV